jgi:hypothetical protein
MNKSGLDTVPGDYYSNNIFPEIVLETTFSCLFMRRKIEFSGLVLQRLYKTQNKNFRCFLLCNYICIVANKIDKLDFCGICKKNF